MKMYSIVMWMAILCSLTLSACAQRDLTPATTTAAPASKVAPAPENSKQHHKGLLLETWLIPAKYKVTNGIPDSRSLAIVPTTELPLTIAPALDVPDIALFAKEKTMFFRWSGFLNIPQPGTYMLAVEYKKASYYENFQLSINGDVAFFVDDKSSRNDLLEFTFEEAGQQSFELLFAAYQYPATRHKGAHIGLQLRGPDKSALRVMTADDFYWIEE